MVKISASELARLVELSSLDLSEDEASAMAKNLEDVLGYVEQLNEVDTEGVEPTYQVLPLKNVWREDEIEDGVAPEKLLALKDTEHFKDRQIKVPRVL